MTWPIVPYRPSLKPALADLWVTAWGKAYPLYDFETRRGWLLDRFAAMETDGTAILVGLVDEAPGGFVTVHPGSGWIDQMLVSVDHQGSGLAAALMEAAKAAAPAGLTLDVNADNDRAIAFYRRQGFVRTGGRVNEQGRAIDLMAWAPRPVPPVRRS
ncbi:GNAT family N-acetyltransferase [Phreatobacter sp.]|uniref:GNAT family N-acetyltransferase n=1 Tax=Phreatobacter sp. TaxID=1966341 RepID=UPI0025E5EA83|nr:GNAT family N-acetyltransferase [Phreatobacter sp.]